MTRKRLMIIDVIVPRDTGRDDLTCPSSSSLTQSRERTMRLTAIAALAAMIMTACGDIDDAQGPVASGADGVLTLAGVPYLAGQIGDASFNGPASLDLDTFDGAVSSARATVTESGLTGYFILTDVADLASFSVGPHTISNPPKDSDTDTATVLVCVDGTGDRSRYDQEADHTDITVSPTDEGLHFDVVTSTADHTDGVVDVLRVSFDIGT